MTIPDYQSLMLPLLKLAGEGEITVRGSILSSSVFDVMTVSSRRWPPNLEGANLSGADLSGASFNGAILRKVTMTGCNVTGITVRDTDFNAARR